jgi:hypothetical protein
MKRLTIVIIAMIVVLLLVVPLSLWFLIFEKPIKADPNELVLSADELVGWELIPDDSFSNFAICHYRNASVEVGNNLRIEINCFDSTSSAKAYFNEPWVKPEPTSPSLGDEGGRWNGTAYADAGNGTFNVISKQIIYRYREANIVVQLFFETDESTPGHPLDPNGTYYEPWMEDIAIQQMSKIDSFNIHVL